MKTFIILCDVNEHSRKDVDGFNNATFEDYQQLIDTSKLKIEQILDIENFVEMSNDQDINYENTWMAYVHIKDYRL